jgi:hypothetical protein
VTHVPGCYWWNLGSAQLLIKNGADIHGHEKCVHVLEIDDKDGGKSLEVLHKYSKEGADPKQLLSGFKLKLRGITISCLVTLGRKVDTQRVWKKGELPVRRITVRNQTHFKARFVV